jgi:hypothetical protein
LALLLATADDASVRDPEEAQRIAHQLVAASGRRHPLLLGTLAVTLASSGKRDEATRLAAEAVAMARQAGQKTVAAHLERVESQIAQGWPGPPREAQ